MQKLRECDSWKWLFLVALVLVVSPSVKADHHLNVLTAPEVKKMLASTPNATLIHALSRIEFEQQHIPGSINIPTDDMAETQALPVNKATPLIFYCMGIRCKYSYKSAEVALEKGYSNVYWFKGGIPEWRKYDYPMKVGEVFTQVKVAKLRNDKVQAAIEKDNAFVLDVRPFYWHGTKNYLRDSVNIPLLELDRFLHVLPKNRPIIVVDGFMKQSVSAAKYLGAHGYDVRGVLRGGLNRWEKANLPVVTRDKVRWVDLEKGIIVKGEI